MKLTKKLFIAIMTMALLVVTFSASTFAWFTLGQTSEIETVKINVQAGKGMEISEDGDKWLNNIRLTDDKNNNAKDLIYSAISSYKELGKGVRFFNEKGEEVTDAATAAYFEKDIYVRLTNTDNHIDFAGVALKEVKGSDLKYGTDVTEADGNTERDEHYNEWVVDAEFTAEGKTFTEGGYERFDALNAVKISFEVNEKGEAALIYGYANTENQGNPLTNGIAKVYADVKEYSLTIPATSDQANAPLATLPSYVYDADLANNGAVILEAGDFFTAAQASASGAILANHILDDSYCYAKVTVRFWLEGWDADCINAILEQKTTISFKIEAFGTYNG